MNINKINKILQKGGLPLYPDSMELPVELTIRIFDFLTVEQLLLLLDDEDTRYSAISAIKNKLLYSKLDIETLLLLYNHPLFKKIIILFILKELNKQNVSLLFVQDIYMNFNNKGIRRKIRQMVDSLYNGMFDSLPQVITNLNGHIVDNYLVKLAYIRIFIIVQAFFEKYPDGIIGTEVFNTEPGISYKFTIQFKKPEYTKQYIIDPGNNNNDCYISTPDYIWQILEDCNLIMLYNKLVELINNSFEYFYVLDKVELFQVSHKPKTETTESTTVSKIINTF
jgi:hypothetical protein